MNIIISLLQVLAALIYGASGVMKVFIFDKASEGVRSFNALPKTYWRALGIVELICVTGLVLPIIFSQLKVITILAASILALESLIFIYVHSKYHEQSPLIMSCLLGLIMLVIAIGRQAIH